MKITDFLLKDYIKIGLEGTTKKEVLEEMVDILVKAGKIHDKEKVVNALLERENLGTTGIGQGIAMPHAKIEELSDEVLVALGISKKGISFSSLDGELVYIVFLFLSSEKTTNIHLKILAKASQLLKDKYFREPLSKCNSKEEAIEMITEEEE